ncbi:MAG: hypothetical protein KID04_14270, partial [Clostridium sp.]|nr:hypothetical protein [Clostridium sp.]
SKLPPWRIFASFLFVKKGRARPGLRGKPCASRNPVRGPPAKNHSSHQNKIEKAPLQDASLCQQAKRTCTHIAKKPAESPWKNSVTTYC